MKCTVCGLGYEPSFKPDVTLHKRMHKQWLEVCEYYGFSPVYSHEIYQNGKHDCRHIIGHKEEFSIEQRINALAMYLQVQWKEKISRSIQFNSYKEFQKSYPSIVDFYRYSLDYGDDTTLEDVELVQQFRRRYNI